MVIVPGYFATAADYGDLEQQLRDRGWQATTVPLTKRDWLPTVGGRSVQPVLERLDETVQALRARTGADRVDLVSHSAGGWIGRIYLGDRPYAVHRPDRDRRNCWHGAAVVHTLVCLGTPHVSQERWTRKNLDFVNQTYPGAHHAPAVRYLCVAGRAIAGAPNPWRQRAPGAWLAYQSYGITSGDGRAWGDGITPIAAAHLAGADNHTLDGIWHSPRSPGPWYGSPDAIDRWCAWLEHRPPVPLSS